MSDQGPTSILSLTGPHFLSFINSGNRAWQPLWLVNKQGRVAFLVGSYKGKVKVPRMEETEESIKSRQVFANSIWE